MPRLFTLLSLSLIAAGPRAPTTPVHDIHLTHARMVVQGNTITCRIRVFHDDAEAVLRRFTGRPDLRITDGASQDSAFQRYFDSKVSLRSGGRRLHARVIESGRDPDAGIAPMWWYVLEYRAPGPIAAIAIRHEFMFEQFDNQRNIVTLVRMPREERYSLYFAAGDNREQVVTFRLGGREGGRTR